MERGRRGKERRGEQGSRQDRRISGKREKEKKGKAKRGKITGRDGQEKEGREDQGGSKEKNLLVPQIQMLSLRLKEKPLF